MHVGAMLTCEVNDRPPADHADAGYQLALLRTDQQRRGSANPQPWVLL